MPSNFLLKLKNLLEDDYSFEQVSLLHANTIAPKLIITLVRENEHLRLPQVPEDEIQDALGFIRKNYPDLQIKKM